MTRVEMAHEGYEVVVLLVPTGVTSAVVFGQVQALTADGYHVRSVAPLSEDPHVTAFALARPLRMTA